MTSWIAEVRGRMYAERITAVEVARQMSVRPEYLSLIFNERRSPKKAEERIRKAVDEIIEKRKLTVRAESLKDDES